MTHSRFFMLIAVVLTACALHAEVSFHFTEYTRPDDVRTARMESAVSHLLTEINTAYAEQRDLNLSSAELAPLEFSLSMLWENCHFMCTAPVIEQNCLATSSGYQVRNIPLMINGEDIPDYQNNEYQEAVISFDRKGNLESFTFTIPKTLYTNVIREDLEVTDLRRRQVILDYVERFRTAYVERNMPFLEQVFSEDALIITGKVIRATRDGIPLPERVEFRKQSKTEYLARLDKVFKSVRYLRIIFDDIKVVRHPTNIDFYGVTLHQQYRTNSYEDDGYVFLLWDFTESESPKIHVRTWQPSMLNGQPVPEKDIFKLSDFDF